MKAKGVLLATVAGTIVAPVANAADMPIKAQPKTAAAPAVAAAPSWAGLYVGVHAGVAWHQSKAHHPDSYYGASDLNDTKTGFIGGGQIGYNLQFGNVIAGLEADISGLDAKTKASNNNFIVDNLVSRNNAESDIKWMATARGRLGLAAGDLLVFVTGGIAWADVRNTWTFSNVGGGPHTTWSSKGTRTAPVFGGGIDYMFSPHWTGRLEGLWANFGSETIKNGVQSQGGVQTTKPTSFKNSVIVVRGALNYQF